MMDYHLYSITGDRDYNEDYVTADVSESRSCFVVCDGLGGQGKGDQAARLVAESIQRSFREDYVPDGFFEKAVTDAEQELMRQKHLRGLKREMMTTLVSLVIDGNRARCCHAGDSRMYYFTDGVLIRRTMDHSVPQMLANSGEIREKKIRFHPDRNRLLKVLGTDWDGMEAEVSDEMSTGAGTSFLLCTDGFWECVDERIMQKLLRKTKTAGEWVEQMGAYARKHAIAGKMDNASAIGIRIG
ncbi:MAG: serine/threonine-protein phosphatase [Lachnospiraceae bacterium]|nr:serine/threonine-protein phosphatase [Lachnospiraceae bacterium]